MNSFKGISEKIRSSLESAEAEHRKDFYTGSHKWRREGEKKRKEEGKEGGKEEKKGGREGRSKGTVALYKNTKSLL